jgi:cytochrome c oxidase cbb3-type subunit III
MSYRNLQFVGTVVAALAIMATAPLPARADGTKIETVYNTYCVQCHGLHRDGTGVNLPALSTKPRDHTDAKGMSSLPDDEIFNAIKNGGQSVNKSVLMPAWGGVLNDEQITEMVHYLRTVCKCGK